MIGCWVGGVGRASMSILHVWLSGRRCPYATPCSSQPAARVLVAATQPNTKRAANTAQPTPSAPPASEIPAWGLGVFFFLEGMVACSTQPTPSRLLPTWMVRRVGFVEQKGFDRRGESAPGRSMAGWPPPPLLPADATPSSSACCWLAAAPPAAASTHALNTPRCPPLLLCACAVPPAASTTSSRNDLLALAVRGAPVQPTHAQPPDRSGGQARQRVRSGLRG